ncbi:RagB/SusD family nutrient uptake outer membrane protein [Chryseobacterium sp. FH1]|uniref:RagB/SusD family nutrient uptake outer membrane protein n=1 Tax=Chryseobacterium sp. FH1 TaxID=1233951 RepID=UPI0004E301A7|nr:RagB/SusD family nutrient uptake outer membrane protein [Chryseobacterium sp. FH1]KFC24053.1 hypothetical protein IO90_01725 [Chryseobacterium sp. FH1]
MLNFNKKENMKRILYSILITGTLTTTINSCSNDYLENYTPGALTEEVAITNSSDLQRLLNSTLGIISSRSETLFNSVFTDEIGIGFVNGGQGLTDDWVFFAAPTSSGPSSIWNSSYIAIARINRIIEYADIITPANPDDAKVIARYKAEALVLRAYLHLKVLAYFTTDMKDDNALAGIKSDRVYISIETDHARVTNGEMYSFIHADLDSAISIYNTVNPPANPVGSATIFPSLNLAKFVKARAYSYKGDYTNAELWADDVIANSGIVLASTANYTNLFFTDTEPANTEVIFRLKRTQQQNSQTTNLGNGYAFATSTVNGSPYFEIGRALFNKIPTNDVRYTAIVHNSSIIDPNYATSPDFRNTDKLILGKHRGNSARGVLNVDFKLARISEMYFIKAEARVNAGDLTGAGTVLKQVLDRRFTTAQNAPTFSNAQVAWSYILNQRRIEFAFEAYRFIDIKRLGTLAGQGIDRDPADYSSTSANYPGANPANLPLDSYKWALPIPQSETRVNKIVQQNPGY